MLWSATNCSRDGRVGILNDPLGNLVDSITFGALPSNISYGVSFENGVYVAYQDPTPRRTKFELKKARFYNFNFLDILTWNNCNPSPTEQSIDGAQFELTISVDDESLEGTSSPGNEVFTVNVNVPGIERSTV